MLKRILPVLPMMAAAFVPPAHAQQPTPDQQPGTYDYQQQSGPSQEPESYGYQRQPGYDYGQQYSAYYEFDRGLLNAVNGCAYRAARARLGRVVVQEVDRTGSNRFQVAGRAEWRGYFAPGSAPGAVPPSAYGYPRYGTSFTCAADRWGRVISWTTDHR